MKGFWLGRPKRDHVGLAAAAAVLLGGIVVAGMADGEPTHDVRLLSGAAWLTSAKVGQVTLLDGSSAEVAAQVQVAPAGNSLEVVQQGPTAFAVDQSTGTVRRIDGATFDLSSPGAPIPDTRNSLTAMPGPDVLYTLDNRRGVLANTNPLDLTRRGELVSLASELVPGSAAVDDAGTLWAIDTRTGDLTHVMGGKRNVRRQVAQPGPSVLAISNGHPVVVDIAARKAIEIDRSNGRSVGTIELDLRPTDTVEVSGSAHSDRLYLVLGRGVLNVCDLSTHTCDSTIALNTDSTYGAAVETGNQLFVPDYTTGRVLIIDLAQSRIIARPTVLSPTTPFQLFTRDGVVFYNDTNSERAGVIQLDGTVVTAAKYDPENPDRGLTQSSQQSAAQPTRSADSVQPTQPTQTVGPRNPQSLGQDPSGSGRPNQPTGNPDPGSPSSPGAPPPGNPVPRLEISMSTATPKDNEPVTLRVTNTNGEAPTSAHWTFGDGEEDDGTTTSHNWATARPTPYLVTVTATMPDDQVATTSVNVTVSETLRVRLTVNIPGAGGQVSGGGIACPGRCFVDLLPDTQITLTANPDADHLVGHWGGGCSGTTNTCDVTVDVAKTVTYTFEPKPPPKVTLTIGSPANGVINRSGGGSCPSACQADLDQGSQVQLTARPNSGFVFGGWGGACAGQGATCSLTMAGDRAVSATFPQEQAPFVNSLICERSGNNRFFCDGDAGPAGVQIRWTIGRSEFSDTDTNFSSGCPGDNFGVTLTVSNSRGEASRSDSISRCDLPPN